MAVLININENSVPEFNILNKRRGGRIDTKAQWRCIPIAVSSEKKGWVK